MKTVLYQKIGVVVGRLAQEFLTKDAGERILSISEYQEKLKVSRGTVQNALNYLKDSGAVRLRSRGHMGTFIEHIDYIKLQKHCLKKEILGIMPLPYSKSYEGLATAFYEELRDFDFNMAYIRSAQARIRLVMSGVYDFAVCSQYAAEQAVKDGSGIQIVNHFGPGSYLSAHVLILRDPDSREIEDGMRVAYDPTSFDQKEITESLVKGKKNITFVEMRTHQTVGAIQAGEIDAGVWNYDEILESGNTDIHYVTIHNHSYGEKFSCAVLVTSDESASFTGFLQKFINRENIIKIQGEVKSGRRKPNF